MLRPRTRDALARTRSTGAHVVVVTGRMFRAVRPYLEQAQLDDLVVCYQGAVVADPATGEFLLHVPIPLAEAREAMDAVLAAGFHLNCYVDDLLYVAEVTPEARRYADFQHLEIHAVGDLRAWLDRDPTKLVAVGDPAALDELEEELVPRFAGRLFISKSLPYFLEFAHPDVSKGSGLAFVAERLGFRAEETVACGDGENDRELLDWAGFGVAVANAHEDVLARADLVVPSVQRGRRGRPARGLPRLRRVIDARAARAEPDEFRRRLARKGAAEAFDAWLAADARWRELVPRVDELRSRTKVKGKPTPEQLEELRGVKEELQQVERELAEAEAARDEALAQVPNPPDDSAPDGFAEEDAEVLRVVGEPVPPAEAKEHTEIGRFDMERAARLSGSRFGYLIGDTALLALALYRFALDTAVKHGHTPMLPPVLVREDAMYGTGFFPTERSNIYALEADELYLTGTSEVALAGLHMGEILEELPLRYSAFSTNFRREAGAAGKDTRGMFRVHQFNKVELFVFCDPAESSDEHERLLAIEEEILQALGLPYRVVNVAAGDLGAPAAKKYDIEGWFPFQERYRELTSASNTTDFQARRLGIRYRVGSDLEPVHTLNGTATTDRTVLAILENFQGDVPDVLREYGAPERVTP